jgi:alanyl-tRNA synthetase
MHRALRSVLGDHATQAGSLVEPDKLRFDFTHFSALTKDELAEVQKLVNEAILVDFSISANTMPMDEAKKLGVMALFGEKYGDMVRVINIGDGMSTELCGGTHLSNTAGAGAFNITAEFSIASGVRRIEATTGNATLETLAITQENLSNIAAMLKATSTQDITAKLEQNMMMLREARSKLDSAASKETRVEAARLLANAQEIGGLKIIATIIDDLEVDIDKLRKIEDSLRDLEPSIVAVLAIIKDEKITIAAACGKKAIEKGLKAGDLMREITKICGGSGGGKPDFAMGGGKDKSKLPKALAAVDGLVKARLG